MLINVSPLKAVFVLLLHMHIANSDIQSYVATFSTQSECEFVIVKIKAAHPDHDLVCLQDDLL